MRPEKIAGPGLRGKSMKSSGRNARICLVATEENTEVNLRLSIFTTRGFNHGRGRLGTPGLVPSDSPGAYGVREKDPFLTRLMPHGFLKQLQAQGRMLNVPRETRWTCTPP